jgi:hypothetical protein
MQSNYLESRKAQLLALKAGWDDDSAEPISEQAFHALEAFQATSQDGLHGD